MARRRQISKTAGAEGGLIGAASRIRTLMTRDRQLRQQVDDASPDLADAIGSLIECVDVLHPRRPDPTPGLFDGSFTRIPNPE